MRLLYQMTTGEKEFTLDAGEVVFLFKAGEHVIAENILLGLMEIVTPDYQHVIKEMLMYVRGYEGENVN